MECLSCNDGLRGSLPCNCEAGLNITINQQAARIAELEAACKLENELKTAGALRELKLMGEVGELRKQLADLRGEVSTCLTSAILGNYGDACNPNPPNRAWWSGGTWLHPGDVVIELSGEEFRRLTGTRAGKDHT